MNASDVSVLVVDDNLELLESYANLISVLGFKARTAVNGQLALELIEREPIHFVFTDLRMPVMNGVELLLKIRERPLPRPKVLITSGFSDYRVDTLFDAGASGFLAKPVNLNSIQRALQSAFMKPEDKWRIPAEVSARKTLEHSYESFADMIAAGEVKFGCGGFFLKQERLSAVAREPVNFRFTFAVGQQIEGAGLVQWTLGEPFQGRAKGVGIEIIHLSDACRAEVSNWIRAQKFKSYIPLQ